LPAWDEILSAAPPVVDRERLPRPTAVPGLNRPEPKRAAARETRSTPVTAQPAVEDSQTAPGAPARRPLTEAEAGLLAQIGALLAAGKPAEAADFVEAQFRGRPEAADRNGRPVYLLESLRCALLLGRTEAAQDFATRLRAQLAPADPIIETLCARVALLNRNHAGARAAWRAALARAPGLPEAVDWLTRHPLSPDGGVPALDLVAPGPDGARPLIAAPLPLALPPQQAAAVPDWSPGRLHSMAILSVDADGNVAVGDDRADARSVPGASSEDLALVLRHPHGIGQSHAFTEVLLATLVLQRTFLGHLRPARVYAGRQPWAMPPQAMPATVVAAQQVWVQPEMLAVLFPGLRVVGDFEGAVREANVLVVDGALRNPATGTLIGSMMPHVTQWVGEARGRALAAFGLPQTAEPPRVEGRKPRAVYLHAPPPRTLADPVRERLLALLQKLGFEVAIADTSAMPWRRQVRIAHGADLIAGVHGPALDLLLWAHPQTKALEFFPEGMRRYDGQLLAEAVGLAYLGLEGVAERGFVSRVRDRWGPPVGAADQLVWALPWTLLEQALAAPVKTVGAG
jgi:hypothetical protein